MTRFSHRKNPEDAIMIGTKRNNQYRQFYMKQVHAKQCHDRCLCNDWLEYIPVIINGVCSNKDFSQSMHPELKPVFPYLHRRHDRISERRIVFFTSQEDGFTTYGIGFDKLMSRFPNVNMRYVIYHKDQMYEEFRVRDIVASLRNPLDRDLPAHRIAMAFIKIGLNKKMISVAHASYKQNFAGGGRRNATTIDPDAPAVAGLPQSSNAVIHYDAASITERRQQTMRDRPHKHKVSPKLELPLHSTSGEYACLDDVCPRSFATMPEMVDHAVHVHRTSRHICPVCKKRFDRTLKLIKHILRHFPPTYACNKCTAIFSIDWKLDQHLDVVHSLKRPDQRPGTLVKCEIQGCNYRGPSHGMVQRHKNGVHLKLIAQYPKCPKRLAVTSIRTHLRHSCVSRISQSHKCPYCPRIFHTFKRMREHRLKIHDEGDQIEEMAERADLVWDPVQGVIECAQVSEAELRFLLDDDLYGDDDGSEVE